MVTETCISQIISESKTATISSTHNVVVGESTFTTHKTVSPLNMTKVSTGGNKETIFCFTVLKNTSEYSSVF